MKPPMLTIGTDIEIHGKADAEGLQGKIIGIQQVTNGEMYVVEIAGKHYLVGVAFCYEVKK